MLAVLVASLSLALVPQDAPDNGTTRAKPRKREAAQAAEVTQEFAKGDPIPKLRFDRVLPELSLVRPVQVIQRPGDADNLYILEQPGRILIADPAKPETKEAAVFLDIRERVNDGGNEEGLLSIAFHPDFEKKHEIYCYYTASKPRRSILSRFTVSGDGMSADPNSEQVILVQPQPYSNHNGGAVLFGPDGFLYLSFGDGGACGGGRGRALPARGLRDSRVRIRARCVRCVERGRGARGEPRCAGRGARCERGVLP
jgi:glucose/arabinose dehydrogenase